MIILDTDVVSGAMRPRADLAVIGWLDRQPRASVWSASISVLEIRFGIALLPLGARRTQLERAFGLVMNQLIEDRIVPFDTSAAEETATLMANRRRAGREGELRDSMIAGIAIARGATLATRNIRHFADLPVPVVDPWKD
jgi:predicted nucleic acid-binding protein